LRLRFLPFEVLVGVLVMSGMDVSASSSAGAFDGVGGFGSAVAGVMMGF
jgi:hypothetical protein